MKIRERVLGENHPSLATSYNNIGSVYDKKGDYAIALEYYNKSMKICELVFDEENPFRKTVKERIEIVKQKMQEQK